MAKLMAVSGMGGKTPACFILDINNKRIMLDLGEGPQPGVYPDLSAVGHVDCIVLSHAHMDHAAALHLSSQVGNPPVYATRTTWDFLAHAPVEEGRRRYLPVNGACLIEGLQAITGRCGHSPGGIWVHFPNEGGFTYTGDWSVESKLLPFDMPPAADVLVTDASYGDRDQSLSDQFDAIFDAAADGTVLCVPSYGRGPEMALAFLARGKAPRLGKQIWREIEQLLQQDELIEPGTKPALQALLQQQYPSHSLSPRDIIIATEANAEAGHSAELLAQFGSAAMFIFSGHVPDNTPAKQLLDQGKALWLPWNVHPRQRDIIALADQTAARFVFPAFVDENNAQTLSGMLGDRCRWMREFTYPDGQNK